MITKNKTIASVAVIAMAIGSSSAFAANNMSSNDSSSTTTSASSSSSSSSSSKLQGLYSAEHLMDANVYSKGNSKTAIGEIEDVLLGNGMDVQKFVVQTEGKFGLGGKSYVVSPGDLSVNTQQTKQASKPQYKVMLNMSKQELSQQPVYSDSWLSNAQQQASQAWQNTKQSAQSAWTQLKSSTSNVMSSAQDQASDAKQATSNAADNAADQTQQTADNATDKASNAANKAQNKASNAADKATDKAGNAADKAKSKANNMTNGNG